MAVPDGPRAIVRSVDEDEDEDEDEIFTYSARPTLVAAFVLVCILCLLGVGMIGQGAAVLGIPLVVASAFVGLGVAYTQCYRAILYRRGRLEFHSLLRKRLTAATAVRQIKMSDEEGGRSFIIKFDSGKASIRASRRARDLVDALLTLNPSIETHG